MLKSEKNLKFDTSVSAPFEEICAKKWKEFSYSLGDMVSAYQFTDPGWSYDCFAVNKTGGTAAFEFKDRYADVMKYDDCYIEEKKYNNLMQYFYTYGIVPVYVNFIGKNYVALWVLPACPHPELHQNCKLTTPQGEPFIGNRYGLKWGDAYIYKWQGKYDDVFDNNMGPSKIRMFDLVQKPNQYKVKGATFYELCPECEDRSDFTKDHRYKDFKIGHEPLTYEFDGKNNNSPQSKATTGLN